MSNNQFQFKQFTIEQENCGMKVSTDGVLLGAWAQCDQANKVLDIGCGTGLLSLMLAQRYDQVTIDAVDIDDNAIDCASKNAAHSPWSQHVKVIKQDILSFVPSTHYDAIICNPPYFTSGEATKNESRATARHCQTLSHDRLIECSYSLLNENGRASFILPIVEGNAFIDQALSFGFFLSRKCQISATPAKPASRLLFELSKLEPEKQEENKLVIQENGQYSQRFINLTQAFYLKM